MRVARLLLASLALLGTACGREGTGLLGRIDHGEGGSGPTKIVAEIRNTRAIPISGFCVVTRVDAGKTVVRRVYVDHISPGEHVMKGAVFSDSRPGRRGYIVDCDRDGEEDSWPKPDPNIVERISTPWRLLRQEGERLVVLAASGGCEEFERMDVRESRSEVELKALSVRTIPPSTTSSPDPSGRSEIIPGGCTGELRLDVVAVCLKAPLGDRRLSHARISPDGPPHKTVDLHLPPPLREHEPEPCT